MFALLMCMSLQCTLCKRGQREDLFIPVQLWALVRSLLAYHCLSLFYFMPSLIVFFCCVVLSFSLCLFSVRVQSKRKTVSSISIMDARVIYLLHLCFCFVFYDWCLLIFFKVCCVCAFLSVFKCKQCVL